MVTRTFQNILDFAPSEIALKHLKREISDPIVEMDRFRPASSTSIPETAKTDEKLKYSREHFERLHRKFVKLRVGKFNMFSHIKF